MLVPEYYVTLLDNSLNIRYLNEHTITVPLRQDHNNGRSLVHRALDHFVPAGLVQ
jgi:hypothetical protein